MHSLGSCFLLLTLTLFADKGFLGVELVPAEQGGVRISRVVTGSPAAGAHLMVGDVLRSIDGKAVNSSDAAIQMLGGRQPGDEVVLDVLRGEHAFIRTVVLGERPSTDATGPARAQHVLAVLKVQDGDVVADVGCGSGWLSEEVAKLVGSTGHVYALELRESAVEKVGQKNIPHLTAKLSKPDDVSLPAGVLDLAFLHDVATHVEQTSRQQLYASVARALKPDGRLVIFGRHGKAQEMIAEFRRFGFVPEDEEQLRGLSQEQLDAAFWAGIRFHYVATEI